MDRQNYIPLPLFQAFMSVSITRKMEFKISWVVPRMGPRVPFAPALFTLYFISSRLLVLLYATCVMVYKAVKKSFSSYFGKCHKKKKEILFVLNVDYQMVKFSLLLLSLRQLNCVPNGFYHASPFASKIIFIIFKNDLKS